jgi:hypothetical protein
VNHAVIRLGARHKKWLYSGLSLLWVSGVMWLLFHYFLQTDGDFGPQPHALERWWLRLHGLAGMLGLILFGSLLPNHMKLAWVRKKNRRTGLPMFTVWIWLATTGYALYYFSSDANADWLPVLHWAVGLALPILLLVHLKQARMRSHRMNAHPAPLSSPCANSIVRTPSQPAKQSASA